MQTLPKETQQHFSWFFSSVKKATIILLLIVITSLSAFATHFRYGNVAWTNTTGNTVTFTVQQAWRASAFSSSPITVGSTVYIGVESYFEFGDGTDTDFSLTVTSVDPVEDWFYGITTITHTYSSKGSYTAGFQSCCRISTLQNNNDDPFSIFTTVNVGSGQSSPVSSVPPIVNLASGNANASFGIAAVSTSGNPLTFSLATGTEAASGSFYTQPSGLTVNPNTGVVTFPTTGLTEGALYTSQILISDGLSRIAVDFIIQIASDSGTAPEFDYTVTPANSATIFATAGQPVTFNVKANDMDAGDNVSLNATGLPIGTSTTPVLPTAGNPVSTKFTWTPSISDAGSYVVVFQATDNSGKTALTNVIIDVSSGPVCGSGFRPFIYAYPTIAVANQEAHTIYKGYGPQRVLLAAIPRGGTGKKA